MRLELYVSMLEGELQSLVVDIYDIKECARLSAVPGAGSSGLLEIVEKQTPMEFYIGDVEVCRTGPEEVHNDNEGAVVDEDKVQDEDAASAVEKAEVGVVGTSEESKPVHVEKVKAADTKRRKKKKKEKKRAAATPPPYFVEDLD